MRYAFIATPSEKGFKISFPDFPKSEREVPGRGFSRSMMTVAAEALLPQILESYFERAEEIPPPSNRDDGLATAEAKVSPEICARIVINNLRAFVSKALRAHGEHRAGHYMSHAQSDAIYQEFEDVFNAAAKTTAAIFNDH